MAISQGFNAILMGVERDLMGYNEIQWNITGYSYVKPLLKQPLLNHNIHNIPFSATRLVYQLSPCHVYCYMRHKCHNPLS